MTDNAKKKTIAVFAMLLVVVAVSLILLLLFEEGGETDRGESGTAEETTIASATQPWSGLIPVVDSKFLWQYGYQQLANEHPSEVPATSQDGLEQDGAVNEPQTYFEQITNWRGESVTDDAGNAVTEVHTRPPAQAYTEALTDANGEVVTDSNGDPVTGAAAQERTTAVVGGFGDPQSNQLAQGISDGEKFTRMKIYLNGDYDIQKSSVMRMVLRERSGLLVLPDSLVYNLSNGNCSMGTKKFGNMAYVTKSGGQTVVTLIIPESARPNVKDTTSLQAASTISTFKNSSTGEYIDEFTVAVNLSE